MTPSPGRPTLPACGTIGANLRRIRESRGLSIKDLARMARTTATTVSFTERGISVPQVQTIARLAAVLGVDTTDLLREAGNG